MNKKDAVLKIARACVVVVLSTPAFGGDLPVPPEESQYPNILRPMFQDGTYGPMPGQFNDVTAVVHLNNGSFAVADSLNHRIQVLQLNGRPIQSFGRLGTGLGELNAPQGLAVTNEGNFIVSDTGNHRIVVFTSEGKPLRQWGSFGQQRGQFNEPMGVAQRDGLVYVADMNNRRVQIFREDGTFVRAIGAPTLELQRPVDVAVDEKSNVLVVDQDANRIYQVNAQGEVRKAIGEWGSYSAMFANPSGIAYSSGRFYVADQINHRIQVFDSDGKFLYQFGRHPIQNHEGHGRLHYVERLGASADGTQLIACEPFENRCQIFSLQQSALNGVVATNDSAWWDKATKFHYGKRAALAANLLTISEPDTHAVLAFDLTEQGPKLITKIGAQGKKLGEFTRPSGIAIDKAGRIVVSDAGNRRLQTFELQSLGQGATKSYVSGASKLVSAVDFSDSALNDSAGNKSSLDAFQVREPSAVTEGPDGNLYLIDPPAAKVYVMTRDYKKVREWGSYGTANGQFRTPIDLAFSKDGKKVFIVDHYNYRIQIFSPSGEYQGSWGKPGPEAGNFVLPFGVAVSPLNGHVYVSDTGAHRIQEFDDNGTFVRQWGKWGIGGGDFYKPKGLAIDAKGQVYVTDFGNHRGQVFSATGDFLSEFGIGDGYQAALPLRP